MPETHKTFSTYSDAYSLYSDIVSGRDPDRKNASIFYEKRQFYLGGGGNGTEMRDIFIVIWEKK